MPTILDTLIIRGSLAYVKIHPAVPLVLIAAPQLTLFEAILFVLLYSMIELPISIFIIRYASELVFLNPSANSSRQSNRHTLQTFLV